VVALYRQLRALTLPARRCKLEHLRFLWQFLWPRRAPRTPRRDSQMRKRSTLDPQLSTLNPFSRVPGVLRGDSLSPTPGAHASGSEGQARTPCGFFGSFFWPQRAPRTPEKRFPNEKMRKRSSGHPLQLSTLNSQLSTLNSQLWTLNLQPSSPCARCAPWLSPLPNSGRCRFRLGERHPCGFFLFRSFRGSSPEPTPGAHASGSEV
jgi:hypothetical protein